MCKLKHAADGRHMSGRPDPYGTDEEFKAYMRGQYVRMVLVLAGIVACVVAAGLI